MLHSPLSAAISRSLWIFTIAKIPFFLYLHPSPFYISAGCTENGLTYFIQIFHVYGDLKLLLVTELYYFKFDNL